MWEIFDFFPQVVSKAKGQLGYLLDTLNYFMLYGKTDFAKRESSIRVYAQIVEQTLQTLKILPDCEGAVVCQLLFQSLTGTNALDPFMEPLLDLTLKRLVTDPNPIELKKQLCGIVMASMYYNASLTLQFLESRQMTQSLLNDMHRSRSNFSDEYEQRFFIVGLCRMLQSPQLPASLQP